MVEPRTSRHEEASATARGATRGSAAVVAAVDESDSIAAIGAAIRARRQERGLSLRELSDLTGFSIGFLSQVERGLSALALTSLHKVANALGAEVTSFFPTEPPPIRPLPHLARAGERGEIGIAGSRRTYKLLSGRAPGRVLEPLLVTVQPMETIDEPYSHEGEEFAYVLSGELRYVIDGSEYRLGSGDSIHFHATVPHAIENDTDEPVDVLWVLTPRVL